MDEISLDKFTGSSPRKLQHLEKYLADWIEADPSLLRDGLVIVGQRVQVDAGYIDLLGIDSDGRWVVIEIQKGAVRKAALTQALRYAASIGAMDESELAAQIDFYLGPKETDLAMVLNAHGLDEQTIFQKREVSITVVGTGSDHPLPQFPAGLSYSGSPINVIHFEVALNAAREPVLRRHHIQVDPNQPAAKPKRRNKRPPAIKTHAIERMLRLADENGIGAEFRLFHDEAMKVGMYPRLYRWSIMYAPPQNRTRCLVCVWAVTEKPGLRMYIASRVFAEFYPVSEQAAIACIGRDRWDRFQSDQVLDFTKSLAKLFEVIAANSEKEHSR
jgi:hypothetical protein